MKAILVPTDFSKCAVNAIKYAGNLATQFNAKVILLNIHHIPVPMGEVPQVVELAAQIQKDAKEMLAKALTQFNKDFPKIKAESYAVQGFAGEEIPEQAKKLKADLVVMGTKGANSLLEEIFGSVTSGVVSKCPVPVLAIPEKAKYAKIERIVLSADLYPNAHKDALKPLVEFAQVVGAEVNIFHVAETDMLNLYGFDKEKERMKKAFGKVKISFHDEDTNDVTGSLDKFIKKQKGQVLSCISRKHNFIERLFWRSITRSLTLHTKYPLLALPE